jgi:ribosomal protein S18
LNGCRLPLEYDPDYLRRMVGDEGAMREARFTGLDAWQRITE